MTNEEIQSIKAVIDKASAGPWTVNEWSLGNSTGYNLLEVVNGRYAPSAEFYSKDDAEFCALARTALPQALDEIEILKKVLTDFINREKTTN